MRKATYAMVVVSVTVMAAGSATAQLSKTEQKCVNALNKNLFKIDAAVAKQVSLCLKNHSKGKPFDDAAPDIDTLDECVSADFKGKIEKATTKTRDDFTKLCADALPPFGATDADTVTAAARAMSPDLLRDVFGSDLDSTVSTDKASAICQQAAWKAALKCQSMKLKEFRKCKKLGLKGKTPPGLVTTRDSLRDVCLGTGGNGQPDSKGTIAKKCTDPKKGIPGILDKKCEGLDLEALVPGCSGLDVDSCIDHRVECRVCLALNTADALDRDCDLFDDGLPNLSCPPAGPGVIVSVDLDPGVPGIQSEADVTVGTMLVVDVVVTGIAPAQPLQAYEFDLTFDDALLSATSASNAAFLTAPTQTIEQDIASPDVNLLATTIGPGTAVGDGVLAQVTFDAVALGTASLDLNDVKLAAPFGAPIGVVATNGASVDIVAAIP